MRLQAHLHKDSLDDIKVDKGKKRRNSFHNLDELNQVINGMYQKFSTDITKVEAIKKNARVVNSLLR